MNSSFKKGMIVCAAFAVLACVLALCLRAVSGSAKTGDAAGDGFPVSIHEIMASNDSYPDARGNAYDWIELYNDSDYTVSLTNYKLTDNEQKVRYTFPADAEIPAHGYYVVWCCGGEGAHGYADFSIAKAGGETVVLMNGHGVIVDRTVTLPMGANEAMARDAAGNWGVVQYGTPGFENSEAGYLAYQAAHREQMFPVRINEVMAANRSYADSSGRCCDWIELYNDSAEAVDLSGYLLSDRLDDKGYVFPDATVIPAGSYLVVYCDGSVTDAFYAPFSLTSRGGERILLLTRSNVVLDEVTTAVADADTSYARSATGTWAVSMQPTPGYENSAEGYAAYLAAAQASVAGADVRITEIMPSNKATLQDAFGAFSDWIELTNYGAEAVNLKGYFLSDDAEKPAKWELPEVELPAGARIVVFASGRDTVENGEIHAGFSLNKYQGLVTMYAAGGHAIVSSITYTEAPGDDVSVCTDETSGAQFTTRRATPGFPNTDEGYEAFCQTSARAPGLILNEVMTGNASTLQIAKQYYDWVELKNTGDRAIDLSGYSLSDDPAGGNRQTLPAQSLAPGAFLVVLCTGSEPIARTKYAQAALALNAQDERLYLFDAGGAVVDALLLQDLPDQGSCGRLPGENGQFYFSAPTPGKENQNGRRLIAATPAADTASGVFHDVDAVAVALSGEGTIYYTLDGSRPTERSMRYTASLRLTKTTLLRAAAFQDGKLESRIATWSYIINEPHTLPVVSVAIDPEDLTGNDGIRAAKNLFDRTVERAAHIDCFFGDGGFSTDCGMKLHGAGTRGRAKKKSYKITFRGRYGGTAPLEYPLFEDNATTTFYSILLRNGQDTGRAYVRDEMLPYLARRGTDELFAQDCRYSVLYINGEYQGLYAIKEAFSSGYFSVRCGVSKESVEIQRGYIASGSAFSNLMEYAEKHDLRDAEAYRYVTDRVNLESLIDWCVIEGYSANHDLSVNVRYLRSTEYDDNRWHYALFDLDFGFDGPATFDYLRADKWHGVIPNALVKNEEFRKLFLERMAYLLENVITPEKVAQRCDDVVDSIREEIPRDRKLWPGKGAWETFYARFRSALEMDRVAQLKQSAADWLGVPLSEVESYFGKGAA